jgi:hypothetical protein
LQAPVTARTLTPPNAGARFSLHFCNNNRTRIGRIERIQADFYTIDKIDKSALIRLIRSIRVPSCSQLRK